MPNVQANAVCGDYFFSSQCGNGRGAAYIHIARRVVQELHESSVSGIHVAEFRAGMVGDDFAGYHADLFFDEYLEFCGGAI